MTASDWIHFGALLAALLSLILQQWRTAAVQRQREKRIAVKLKLFYLCQEEALAEEDLISHFKRANPTEEVNETEIRKALYEMLADETLRFRSNRTYKARRNRASEEE